MNPKWLFCLTLPFLLFASCDAVSQRFDTEHFFERYRDSLICISYKKSSAPAHVYATFYNFAVKPKPFPNADIPDGMLLRNVYALTLGNLNFLVSGNLNIGLLSAIQYNGPDERFEYMYDSSGNINNYKYSGNESVLYNYQAPLAHMMDRGGSEKDKIKKKEYGEKLLATFSNYIQFLRSDCAVIPVNVSINKSAMVTSLDSLFGWIIKEDVKERGRAVKELLINNAAQFHITLMMYPDSQATDMYGTIGNSQKSFTSSVLNRFLQQEIKKSIVSYSLPQLSCLSLPGYTRITIYTQNGKVLRIETP